MQKGFTPILIIILIALGIGGYFVYQNQTKHAPQSLNQIQCQSCSNSQDTSCPGNTSCFVPEGSSKGICVPIPKPGQQYTIGQVNSMCGTSFSNETANWKTYTAKLYSFKYPDNWTNDISDEKYFETGTLIHTKDVQYSDFSNFQNGGLIYRWILSDTLPKSDFSSIDDVFLKHLTPPRDMQLISETALTVDNQPAKEKIYRGSNVESVHLVFQYPDNRGYSWLIMDSSIKDFQSNKEDLSQIIKTFKFTQ